VIVALAVLLALGCLALTAFLLFSVLKGRNDDR
jgi:hypothetical protein